MEYEICKAARNKDDEIIPGRKIDDYTHNGMVALGSTITVKGKKYTIKNVYFSKEGNKKSLIVE